MDLNYNAVLPELLMVIFAMAVMLSASVSVATPFEPFPSTH